MPNIRLPDGSVKSFPGPVTVAEVAQAIGQGLARAALAGKLNGKLVDTSHRVDSDAELAIITERDREGVEILRHSTAHLLAYAVKDLFPEAQVTIGPVIKRLLLRFFVQETVHAGGSRGHREAHDGTGEKGFPGDARGLAARQ